MIPAGPLKAEGAITHLPSVLVAVAAAFGVTVLGISVLRAVFPDFRSRELKRGAHQTAAPSGVSDRLPLVGGPALWLALLGSFAARSAGSGAETGWWLLAAISGFFVFGLADDLRKTRAGRGMPEGVYFAAAAVLSLSATALLVAPGAHAAGAASPFALAHWLGPASHLSLGAWYLALILGTALATSFSDGMDGLTAGSVGIATASVAIMAGLGGGAWLAGWPASVALAALGALLWNLPSRWSPANRGVRRAARAYLGDSGALLLGAGSACTAIVAGMDLLWPVIAAPLLLEGLSSLVQAKLLVPAFRRLWDPRLPDGRPLPHQRFPLPLLASPLHYHWEKLGMDRRSTVLLFWVMTLATSVAGVLAAVMPTTGLAAAWIGLGAAGGAAFWGAAMWLRPAFLTREGEGLVLAHGRPWTLGPVRLFRRRGLVGGPETASTAERRGLLDRPMNAHELDERLEALVREATR